MEMQLVLTYIIVAIALVFAGRGAYRLFRNAKKGKKCSCNCGCGGKGTNKKSCL
ncbi:MAG TPA: FeoB-associated Cys-rich membrane protein [Butyricimonas virosa]|uniref:FeoB-associated Cys-rich membrane protein n=1 Tax=Butyricimonas virosa TaxID=544645 RepID=A0A921KZ33_9BACT|nr:FeoB-associated Cys-rich membrane protein [Butyricimonas virosa]